MRVITVVRKPCVEKSTTENVVKHEAGALNIEGCRIDTTDSLDGGAYAKDGKDRHDGYANWRFKRKGGAGEFKQPTGRWPTNVMLAHRPGCRVIGTRKVPSGTAHRENSGGRTIFSETEKKTMPNMTYADEDGMETVPQWACEADCPVASLDRQSGELTSGTGAVKRSSSKDQGGNRASAYGAESRPEGTPVVTYGDTGGASRFYKQVGAKDQPK